MKQWLGCPMINPLCLEDLCLLPFGHDGMLDNMHIRATDPWDPEMPYQLYLVKLVPELCLVQHWHERKFTEQSLIQAGCRAQRAMIMDDLMNEQQDPDPNPISITSEAKTVDMLYPSPRLVAFRPDDGPGDPNLLGWDPHLGRFVCWCGRQTPTKHGQKIHRMRLHRSYFPPPSAPC